MRLRSFRSDDTEALAELFRDSVRELGRTAYSPSQREAWGKFADDLNAFRSRLERGVTLVSLEGEALAAFGQLDPVDCIELLYCGARFARRGHATAIYLQLEKIAREQGVTRLSTIASHLSRPFFEKQGFHLVETERSVFNGAEFERDKMEKPLVPLA